MRPPILRLHRDELIVDSFAGGGGASLGIQWALGRSPDIAINHDAQALAMHQANHPDTKHYRENVWDVDPRAACGDRPVALAWFSPDCTHHSKARGGRPFRDPKKAKRSRALAHVVVRWARAVKPRVIILENVEEFEDWGPLGPDGEPDPARAGLSFRIWLGQLRGAGYVVEKRQLRACDYGAPTTRKRLFIIARSDGLPIVWPKPTHGPGLLPYRTAAECIEWVLPVRSIFGRKKPLAENTLRRIARGLKKYVFECPQPFLVPVGNDALHEPFLVRTAHGERTRSGKKRGRGEHALMDPLPTQCASNDFALAAPTLIQSGWGEREGQAPRTLDLFKPYGTVVAEGVKAQLVSAFLARHYGGGTGHENDGRGLEEPTGTITTRDHHALVASHLLKLRGGLDDHQVTAQDLRVPAPTLTAQGNHLAEVRAFLIAYYGTDQDPQLGLPMHTVTTKHRFGIVTVFGREYVVVDIGMRMLVPRELFRANSFPDSYQIAVSLYGKMLTQEAQVRMCGNSVPPVMAEALAAAQFAEPMALEVRSA